MGNKKVVSLLLLTVFFSSLSQAKDNKLLKRGPLAQPHATGAAEGSAPPVKGVIHVKRASESIDPEREYPILGKKQIGVMNIDPETERPILGQKQVGVVHIAPENERPILGQKQIGVTKIDPQSEYPLLGKKKIGVTNRSGIANDYNDTPIPGAVEVPQILSLLDMTMAQLQDMGHTLANPNLKLYTTKLSVGAIIGTSLLIAYEVYGRKTALAAVVPPDLILKAVGQDGYGVPAHDSYDLADVTDLALEIESAQNNPEKLQSIIVNTDPELLAYAQVVTTYVHRARAIENAKWCPNAKFCS